MRLKSEDQSYLPFFPETSLKIVKNQRKTFDAISDILDANPSLLDAAHADMKKLSKDTGRGKTRKGDYTTESLLRAVVVMVVLGEDLRGAVCRIAETPFLQHFIRLGGHEMMDFTFLDRVFNAVSPETWEKLNRLLSDYAVREEKIDTSSIRTDTTVVETNIHYPTDAWLCWDVWRVFTRIFRRIRPYVPGLSENRFHDRKVKGHYLFVTRYMPTASRRRKREVMRRMKKLIESTEEAIRIADGLILDMDYHACDIETLAELNELAGYLPAAKIIASTARRATFGEETVPASERVFSLFEPHTELLMRGRREKPVEFGHKIQLTQSREKYITDYRVFPLQRSDRELLRETLHRHQKRFGSYPESATADGGFHAGEEEMAALRENVGTLAVPRRVGDWKTELLTLFQAFRAGIEGTISFLKRGFRLTRNLFKGFKHFSAWIGACVFGHNLLKLAENGMT